MPANPPRQVRDRPRQGLLRRARLAFAVRAYDEALDAVGKARDAGANPGRCLDLELRCLVRLGQTARAHATGKAGLARGETPSQTGYIALTTAALAEGLPQEAEELADAALAMASDNGKTNGKAITLKYTAAAAHLPDEMMEDGFRARIFAPGHGALHAHGILQLAQERGLADGAVTRLFEQARARWPDAPELHSLSGVLHLGTVPETKGGTKPLPADIDPKKFTRPVVWIGEESDRQPPPIVTENAGTGDVLVHFSGLVRRFNRGFGLDSYVSMTGYSAIYLTDLSRMLFTTGIDGLGDNFDSAAQGVQRLINGFGPRRSLTMFAASAGGFGALHYGITLGADRVLCLSGVTTVDRAFLDRAGDRRGRALLYRLEKAMPPHLARVRTRLEACNAPPRIDMVYGADHPEDRAQAEDLRGLPGVRLYPITGLAQHTTQNFLRDAGMMPAVLAGDMSRLEAMCNPMEEQA